jgi:hypothetical protein
MTPTTHPASYQPKGNTMLPLLALAVPTIIETLAVAAGTAAVITAATRATNDAYDSASKKKKEEDKG